MSTLNHRDYEAEARNFGAALGAGTDSMLDLAYLVFDGVAAGHFVNVGESIEVLYRAYASSANAASKTGVKIDLEKKDSVKTAKSNLNCFAKIASPSFPRGAREVLDEAIKIKMAGPVNSDKTVKKMESTYNTAVKIARDMRVEVEKNKLTNLDSFAGEKLYLMVFPKKEAPEAPSYDGECAAIYETLKALAASQAPKPERFTELERYNFSQLAVAFLAKREELKVAPIVQQAA